MRSRWTRVGVVLVGLLLSGAFVLDRSVQAQVSPGARIAFASGRKNGRHDIYVMDTDGGDQHNLSNSPDAAHTPAWSPDGKSIAFATRRDGGNLDIHVMDADGGNQRNVSDHPGWNFAPAWGSISP